MTTKNSKKLFIISLLMFVISAISFSCKKDASTNSKSSSFANDEASVTKTLDSGVTILTLKPGPRDGQDDYVSKLDNHPNDGNTNLNSVPELVMGRWYISQYGDSATERSYIKFTKLADIPSTAQILSANLFLYGVSSSQTYPNGNSYYPGSNTQENSCYVQRVTGKDWDQNTLTWNNMPNTTTQDEATIHASTSEFSYNAEVNVTAMVAAIVSSGKNHGFCLRLRTENAYRSIIFSTSESNSVLRPKLVIRYK